MKRSVISLIIIGLHLIILTVALRIPVTAHGAQQTIPPVEETPTAPAVPIQIAVNQQVPLLLTIQQSATSTETLTETITGTALLTETIAITLDLRFNLTLTDSVTATVPTTVNITFADAQTATLPISLTIALAPTITPTASIIITPLLPIDVTSALTATESLTDTETLTETGILTTSEALTPTVGVTTTVPPQVLNPTVVSSVTITANLRSGPDTTFEIQDVAAPGQSVVVVAQNADGTWYLLNNGLWLAAFLVENPPTTLPVATEELVTTLREQNPITPTVTLTTDQEITATVTVTTETPAEEPSGLPILVATPTPETPTSETPAIESTDVVTTTGESTADEAGANEPEPTADTANEAPTVTVDANLREGPATTFPVIGGTVTGQELTIVARNEDGSWFQLDNGGWLAAFLIANAPDPATVPLFDENAPPTEVSTGETPAATSTLTPTVAVSPTFGVQENLYAIRVDGIVDRYDFALTQVESLIATAQADAAELENQDWVIQMTTMITLLRSASDELKSLNAPAVFTDAQSALTQAADAYTGLADLLAAAVDQLDQAQLANATAQIAVGNQLLGAALDEVERVTP